MVGSCQTNRLSVHLFMRGQDAQGDATGKIGIAAAAYGRSASNQQQTVRELRRLYKNTQQNCNIGNQPNRMGGTLLSEIWAEPVGIPCARKLETWVPMASCWSFSLGFSHPLALIRITERALSAPDCFDFRAEINMDGRSWPEHEQNGMEKPWAALSRSRNKYGRSTLDSAAGCQCI